MNEEEPVDEQYREQVCEDQYRDPEPEEQKIKVLPLGSNQEKLLNKGRKNIFGRFLNGMAKII